MLNKFDKIIIVIFSYLFIYNQNMNFNDIDLHSSINCWKFLNLYNSKHFVNIQ